MEYKVVERGSRKYPKKIRERLGDDGPERIYYHGPLEFLDRFSMGVICADSIGGRGLMETNQLLFTIREYDMNYIGGWYSIMETEIFRLGLFRRNTTVTLFSAKGLGAETFDSYLLDRFYPPLHEFPERDEYFRRGAAGELLMLSLVEPDLKRKVRRNIMERNFISCVLSDVVFVPYAPPRTKTHTMAKRVLAAGIPVFTLAHQEAADVQKLGIPGYTRQNIGDFLEEKGAKIAYPRDRTIYNSLPDTVISPPPPPSRKKEGAAQKELQFPKK